MTQGQSRAGRRGPAYPLARLALVALLLVIAAAALRGGLPRLALDGRYTGDELPIAAALEAVVLSLLITVLVRRARAPRTQFIAVRLREVLRSVLIAAAVAVPLCYLLTRTVHSSNRPARRLVPPTFGRRGPFQLPAHMSHGLFIFATVVDILLILAVLAALVTGLIMVARRLHWRREAARRHREAIAEFTEDDAEADLKKAVEYGWLALRELDDARGAIIACYLAMERSLAQAGTAREAAETPDELLARAAGSGLVRGGAAARLTEVFYEARFSTRELMPEHRDAAEQALAELATRLSQRLP
jgi:Domain of unknown function (DUF4129)